MSKKLVYSSSNKQANTSLHQKKVTPKEAIEHLINIFDYIDWKKHIEEFKKVKRAKQKCSKKGIEIFSEIDAEINSLTTIIGDLLIGQAEINELFIADLEYRLQNLVFIIDDFIKNYKIGYFEVFDYDDETKKVADPEGDFWREHYRGDIERLGF